ncbi:MAG: hypothetical protein K2R98_17970 [Gemmataceae bacterium]|nr:hypothetical protein [Gemmataceae bacterium]
MKKLLLAASLALPFALFGASKASAGGCCDCAPPPTYKVGISLGICFKPWFGCDRGGGKGCCGSGPAGCGYGPVSAGPWYSYYPYGAHFQTPAPTGFPGWPGPQVSGPTPLFGSNQWIQPSPMMGGYPTYQAQSPGYYQQAPMGYPMNPVQPVNYQGQAPSYWYGQ